MVHVRHGIMLVAGMPVIAGAVVLVAAVHLLMVHGSDSCS